MLEFCHDVFFVSGVVPDSTISKPYSSVLPFLSLPVFDEICGKTMLNIEMIRFNTQYCPMAYKTISGHADVLV